MRKILLSFVFYYLINVFALAQVSTISTKGREFWCSFMQMIPNGNIQYQLALTSETNAQATIRIPGINFTTTITIVPGVTSQLNLTNPAIVPNGEGLRNTGIQVTATADISVFATYQSNARTESTIVLPVQALGSNSEYIVTTIAPQSGNGNSNLVIVATQDNTAIEIIPSAPTLGGRAPNVPFQITLNAGQSFQMIGANVPPGQPRPDLSGTVIRSVPGTSTCKPFAVFAGVTATIITLPGCIANSLQHLWEQQYPVSTWGTRYALTPYTNDQNIRNRGYIFRIIASQDNTRITLNNGAAPQTITLNRGQNYTALSGTADGIDIARGLLIEADKPISVAQITLSQACNGSVPRAGDPSLLMLTPLNQATTRVTVTPARMFGGSNNPNPQNERHFINVLMRTAATASFRITSPTGSIAPFAFQPLAADPAFSYAVIEVGTGVTIPSYTLQSSGDGFGAFIYGYNGPDAYAYAAAATFENQEVNFNIAALPACEGTPLTFTGRGTGITNYEWDFGDGSPVQRGQTVRYTYPRGGIYNVRMRAATGTACGFTDIVKEVQVIEQPRPDLGRDTTICNNTPILLSGGGIISNPAAARLSYQWSTGATTPTITVSQPGRYILTVTNFGQCVGRDTVEVRRRFVQNDLGQDQTVCANIPVPLGFAPQQGITYQWTPAAGLSNDKVSNPIFTPENEGTTPRTVRYILTATDPQTNCSKADTITFTIRPNLLPRPATPQPPVRLCAGERAQIGTESSIQGITYSWTPATGLSDATVARPFVQIDNVTADSVRTRYIQTVTLEGCSYRDTIDVIVYRRPVANAGQDLLLCAGQTINLGAAPVAGLRYQWTPAEGLSSATIANPTIRGENTGDTPIRRSYILRVSNAAGCFSTDTVQVTIFPPLNTGRTGNLRVCSGDTLRLGAAPVAGYTYRWSPAANLSADTIANPVFRLNVQTRQTLTYILTTTANNCTATDTFRIAVEPRFPKLKISGETVLCPGSGQVRYRLDSAQAGVQYAWAVTGGSIQSGQGSREIIVNWGALNPAASIIVGYADPTVCNSGGDTLRVSLTLQLQTGNIRTLGSRDTLCVTRAQNIRYQVRPNAGAVFTWQTSAGGAIVSGQGSNSVSVNWTGTGAQWITVTERLTTPLSTCTGASDTLRVLINPAPNPDLQVQGLAQVCENSTSNYSLAGFPGSRYEWEVIGGAIAGNRNGSSITVNWGAAATTLQPQVRVREISGDGCEGELITLSVQIVPLPITRLIASDSIFCPTRTQGLRYAVSGAQGSSFNWTISGGTITQIADNQQEIVVSWDTLSFPKRLSVMQRSAGGCEGLPLVFNIYYDNPQLEMRNVSVQQANERNIEVQFRIRNALAFPQNFVLSRRPLGQMQWAVAGTVRPTDSLFTDLNLATDESAYEYRLEKQSVGWACNINPTAPHNSIWLRGAADEASDGIRLNWNGYSGWRVGQYEIWRKLDNEPDFRLLTTVNGNALQFNDFSGKEGFTHCFRILAREAGGNRHSWSNDICLTFRHPITVPNVITPNGDGRNETFVIPNLEPYTENEIFIYNRSHQLIYNRKNYQQDWNGNGYPSGTYYYLLRASRPAADGQTVVEEFKGWLQVIRE
ncbi:T9SS type B sorting domain-containing protein [Rhodoflexus sp.]